MHRWRELHQADVARLHLGLEQEVEHAVEEFGEDTEHADFRLVDDRLLELDDGGEVGSGAKALHAKEVPRVVHQIAGAIFDVPAAQRREGDRRDHAVLRRPAREQSSPRRVGVAEPPLAGACRRQEPGRVHSGGRISARHSSTCLALQSAIMVPASNDIGGIGRVAEHEHDGVGLEGIPDPRHRRKA